MTDVASLLARKKAAEARGDYNFAQEIQNTLDRAGDLSSGAESGEGVLGSRGEAGSENGPLETMQSTAGADEVVVPPKPRRGRPPKPKPVIDG